MRLILIMLVALLSGCATYPSGYYTHGAGIKMPSNVLLCQVGARDYVMVDKTGCDKLHGTLVQ
jgi:hypothetical protein